jgi:hypothetical protein
MSYNGSGRQGSAAAGKGEYSRSQADQSYLQLMSSGSASRMPIASSASTANNANSYQQLQSSSADLLSHFTFDSLDAETQALTRGLLDDTASVSAADDYADLLADLNLSSTLASISQSRESKLLEAGLPTHGPNDDALSGQTPLDSLDHFNLASVLAALGQSHD